MKLEAWTQSLQCEVSCRNVRWNDWSSQVVAYRRWQYRQRCNWCLHCGNTADGRRWLYQDWIIKYLLNFVYDVRKIVSFYRPTGSLENRTSSLALSGSLHSRYMWRIAICDLFCSWGERVEIRRRDCNVSQRANDRQTDSRLDHNIWPVQARRCRHAYI